MTEERFLRYSLAGVLPEGNVITLDTQLRVLTRLTDGVIVAQEQATGVEFTLICALFEATPYYAPHEQMLSAFTGNSRERCRAQLHQAQEDGIFDEVMRPVRNALSRGRLKLTPLGIDARNIIETGYQLFPDNGHIHGNRKGRQG